MRGAAHLSVEVASYSTGFDAELGRAYLESTGIAARIEGDMLAGAANPLSGGVGVKLFVAHEDADEARTLLRTHERELAEERKTTDTDDDKVGRAFRLAIIGWLIFPGLTQAISLYWLASIRYDDLGDKGKRQYTIAMWFDVLIVAAVIFWLANRLGLFGGSDSSAPLHPG